MNDANLNSINSADERKSKAPRMVIVAAVLVSGRGSPSESAGRSHSHWTNEPSCFSAASLSVATSVLALRK